MYGCAYPKKRDFENCWSHLGKPANNEMTMCIDGQSAIHTIHFSNTSIPSHPTLCTQVGNRSATDEDGIFQVSFKMGRCKNRRRLMETNLICQESPSGGLICLNLYTQEELMFER